MKRTFLSIIPKKTGGTKTLLGVAQRAIGEAAILSIPQEKSLSISVTLLFTYRIYILANSVIGCLVTSPGSSRAGLLASLIGYILACFTLP